MPDYVVKVVDVQGDVFGTVDDARVTSLSFELNGPGAATIALPTTHPDAALMVPGREVQIFWDGGTDPIFWGPIVRPQAGLDETTWQCAGLLWYFEHRFMGRADRVNQLVNGDFEDGETDWTFHNGVTHSIDTGTFLEGSQSLELEGGSADHDGYAAQTYTHTTQYHPDGDAVTVSAWVYIPSADYLGGAIEDFGLVARRRSSAGEALDAQIATIGDDTVQDTWIPLEVIIAAVKEDDTVDVLLFPPHGVAFYDLVTLTLMESLSFGYPTATDAANAIEGIVQYAQDLGVFTHGKSDLSIGVDCPDVGTTVQVAYQFAEHRNIADAILEYVRQGLCDISIEITATTRTFTIWPKIDDARGLGKGSLYGVTLELDVNVADFTWSSDLENGASSVVILGPGDGSDRPEGGAVDPAFAGGAFTSEIVEQAPDNTTIGQLDARARERVAIAARPEILEVTTLPAAGIIGDLAVGDTVPVVISRGWVGINDTYRVARIEVDLLKDQATITLNPLP